MTTIDNISKAFNAVKNNLENNLEELKDDLIKRREETEKTNHKLDNISINLPGSEKENPLDVHRYSYFIINWEMDTLYWIEGTICKCETHLKKIGGKQLINIFKKDDEIVLEKGEFSSGTLEKVAHIKDFFKKWKGKLTAEGKNALNNFMEVLEGYEFAIDNFNDDRRVHRKKIDAITIHKDEFGDITYYKLNRAGEIAISITKELKKRMVDESVPNLAKEEVEEFLRDSRNITDRLGYIPNNRSLDFTSTKDSLPPV